MSGQHIQCHAVGARCHTVLLPLEVEVATLPLVVADADAVGHREREGVGLVPEGHKLQLVQERSPGRNIRLPGERETEREIYRKHRTVSLHWNDTKMAASNNKYSGSFPLFILLKADCLSALVSHAWSLDYHLLSKSSGLD